MSSNTASTAMPIFEKGDKVKLLVSQNLLIPLAGRLRYGDDLKTYFNGNQDTITYKPEDGTVFTVFDNPQSRQSMAPGDTQRDPMSFRYRLILGPTNYSRFVYKNTKTFIPVGHTYMKLHGSSANMLLNPDARYAYLPELSLAILTKSVQVQQAGGATTNYPVGTFVRVSSPPLTKRGAPAEKSNTLADNCKYNVILVNKEEVWDIFWKANVDIAGNCLEAA